MEQHTTVSSFPARAMTPAKLPYVDRGGGARTTPLVTADIGATAFLNGITRFDPGAEIRHHTHNCVESVLILEGEAVLDVEGVETPLRPFDTTFVPANVAHHFRNASETLPMAIFWTYASTEATRTIVEVSATARIDAEQRSAADRGRAVLEIIDIAVRPGSIAEFETAAASAAVLFQRAPGCLSFELVRSVEEQAAYKLFIEWAALDDHLVGFRGSDDFATWRELVTPHLAAPLSASHVRHVLKGF